MRRQHDSCLGPAVACHAPSKHLLSGPGSGVSQTSTAPANFVQMVAEYIALKGAIDLLAIPETKRSDNGEAGIT